MASPSFPPPALVDKVLELGFGSGPWRRSDLAERWGDSSANKFIADAKGAGWLVSPLINTFYVPPARDLMIVNWLAGLARTEFLISRMLAAAGFRSWCLSAWARSIGVETDEAVFVTDLGPAPSEGPRAVAPTAPPPKAIVDRNRSLARRIRTLPFLDNVILAPFLPQSRRVGETINVALPAGLPKKLVAPNWILDDLPKKEGSPLSRSFGSPESDARRISYPLTPVVDDIAWILACIGALGLPRFNEMLPGLVKKEARREPPPLRAVRTALTSRIRNWAGLFSPPEPNTDWRTVFESGRTQYLLVPASMWALAASLSNARRFQDLAQTGVQP